MPRSQVTFAQKPCDIVFKPRTPSPHPTFHSERPLVPKYTWCSNRQLRTHKAVQGPPAPVFGGLNDVLFCRYHTYESGNSLTPLYPKRVLFGFYLDYVYILLRFSKNCDTVTTSREIITSDYYVRSLLKYKYAEFTPAVPVCKF